MTGSSASDPTPWSSRTEPRRVHRGRHPDRATAAAVAGPSGDDVAVTDDIMTERRRPLQGSALLVLAGIVVVALNLRATITVVGPLVPTIRADLGIDNVAMGTVGTLPVLAFGLVAPLAPALARRIGIGRSLAGSMALLTVGTVVRSLGGYPALLVGTVLLGVAIGIGNVLVPALIKGAFPGRVGQLTSVYGSLMVVGATVSAAAAVPLAEAAGWPFSLGIWAVPAAVGTAVVVASVVLDERGTSAPDRAAHVAARRTAVGVPARVLHRSRLAWHVTAFMGLQSLLFYVALAWLPDVLVERGMTDARAGVMVSILNVGGLVGVLVAPAVADRVRDQRWYATGSGAAAVLGVLLLLVPGTALAPVASAVLGLGLGATVGLAFAFFSLRTSNATEAAAVSGMAQTWGYLVSALGPIAWGALRDASASWTVPLLALLVVALGTTVAGHLAGRDHLLDLAALGRQG